MRPVRRAAETATDVNVVINNAGVSTRAGLLDDLAGNEDLPGDARTLINTMLEWRQLTKLRSPELGAEPRKDLARATLSALLSSLSGP